MNKDIDELNIQSYVYATSQQKNPDIAYTLEIAEGVYADYLSNGDVYGVEFPTILGNGIDFIVRAKASGLGPKRDYKKLEEQEKVSIGGETAWDKD
jgi:hypothetical protein